ncbi:MAG: hydrogen gas-evolving membrane-bound hydrogenase subunit E [Thermodesulfobacteriota bacterium]
MRGIRSLTLTIIAFLCTIFIYIAEDIPIFGDPEAPTIKYVELFRIDSKEIDSMEGPILPQPLVQSLKKRGFPPISRIEKIPHTEGEWNGYIEKEEPHYPKEEKYYFIKKEQNQLKIYRYAFVVRWIEKGFKETAVPNMVTYGLADYRGYDTLGETTVIFTAGVSVILLLRRKGRL